jgi:LysR family cys regulon transcriptional activator
MNFQQLRIVRETVRCGFNLTGVAATLYTSQSGVSKHIKDLEDELGVELFVRKGKRLLGLTEPGKELLGLVERILLDAASIKRLSEQFSKRDEGQLIVATTHTQARYVLPKVVAAFKQQFPKVHLVLHQGNPPEIASLVLDGQVDIGIATESLKEEPQLATFPYYTWTHDVIVPVGHPLRGLDNPSLADIGRWPIVTYHSGFTGRGNIDRAFAAAGLSPDVVMSALDADVIKEYVSLGLGIGIVAAMAHDDERDMRLRRLGCEHLFGENVARIAVRRGGFLRTFAFRFIELCVPSLTEETVRVGMMRDSDESAPGEADRKVKAPRSSEKIGSTEKPALRARAAVR